MNTELETLHPSPLQVRAGGRLIAITPIRVRELAAFTRAVQPIAAALAAGADLPTLVAEQAQAVIDATAVGARLEREFVDGLRLDELLDLAVAVLEVNLDFFAQRLLPRATAGSARLAERMNSLTGLASTPVCAAPDWAGSAT
ncbi:hypothetical protein [Serpentinimonas maccroryi]|uniref:hypothetical protein n=1 Tax=Serpentinimonas maccroryi TaxID=1458426 RepID=UPI0020333AAF|nr:hypothetical protein [Serpentinimonas maccroryi]MCM2480204.1 hypothetical protein [Serpentinimonas maccroryi]